MEGVLGVERGECLHPLGRVVADAQEVCGNGVRETSLLPGEAAVKEPPKGCVAR
jgi:hypothetical protein